MRFRVTKCHGSGNDFPMIDAREIMLEDARWAGVARALADRSGPVGGDGLLLLTEGDKIHPFGFRMFNPDGSEAQTCLNGLRCVARAGFESLGIDRANVRLRTSSVEVARAEDLVPGVYTVRETAGPVDLDAGGWLKSGGHEHIEAVIADLPSELRFTALSIGNPHLVTFVEGIDDGELSRIGDFCENAPPLLPERANVSFVEARATDAIFVRTFERGVGLTDSCGSAMASSTYAACLTDRAEFGRQLTVFNRGGRVMATAETDGMVTIEGNATFEWAGEVTVDQGRAVDLTVTKRFDDEVRAWEAIGGWSA